MTAGGNVRGTPVLSIIIPVFNEAGTVNETIGHLRGLHDPAGLEIIVVDGDPDSGTIRAIVDTKIITATSGKGRARQMNRGAQLASGDVLVFLHADTVLPDNAPRMIRSVMQDSRFVAGAFNLGINSTRAIFRITEQYVAFRTRMTGIPFGDQAIFIRRPYFETLGGYREIALMEDIELMSRIRKRRDRICVLSEKVMTSPRRWEREGILYCTLRNWVLQLLYVLGVSPDRLAAWYHDSPGKGGSLP
jgi:rSAM/selenodomain-associated transferase 2